MIVKAIKTSVFKEGDSLVDFIVRHIPELKEKSVLVVTSKIVALAENRTAEIKYKKELIKKESQFAMKSKYVWLTIKDGVVMASAGIDESNANGKFILLPKNSYKSADLLRKFLQKKYKIKKLGVLITDSRTLPLRAGVVGLAVGYAGFRGIKSYINKKDIFGRKFKFSRTNIADSLASSAVLLMGEGNEQMPLAVINDAPVEFCNKIMRKELYISFKDDMYRPLFSKMRRKHRK
jgi:coenzyme F420-0:L-glutamate ligase